MALSVYAFQPYFLHRDIEIAVSNGATMMPNTFAMQESVRMSLDEHLENLESGRSSAEPIIYYVKKGRPNLARFAQSLTLPGTPIPSALTLLRAESARFSLQASSPVTLTGTREKQCHQLNLLTRPLFSAEPPVG